jgi:hypothetical protein
MKLFSPKQPTRIACWNVRTMYQSRKSAQIAKEMDRYNIEILGLSEVRWNISGMTTISPGHTIIYSGNPNKVDSHEKGVGFLLNKTSKKSLLEWNPISPRIATTRFDTNFLKTTGIQVYAPTNEAQEIEKEDFYNALQYAVDKIPKRDILIIMGDLNAKVGSERIRRERKIRPHDIGNINGELFAGKGDIKYLYNTTRQLSGRPPITNSPVKDSNGKVISKNEEQLKQLKRWKEHFQEVLNRPPPIITPDIEGKTLDINIENISRDEMERAIRKQKYGKSGGVDNIPPEVIKAMDNISVKALHRQINRIWNEEQIPDDWRKGLKLPKKEDLSLCNNWRGITLLSIPSKILCSVILQRIKMEVDKTLRDEQAGFRQDHSCVDQIATLRIIVEQTIE